MTAGPLVSSWLELHCVSADVISLYSLRVLRQVLDYRTAVTKVE
jgi:hypothetical protein